MLCFISIVNSCQKFLFLPMSVVYDPAIISALPHPIALEHYYAYDRDHEEIESDEEITDQSVDVIGHLRFAPFRAI
jgi:hypothetical protein